MPLLLGIMGLGGRLTSSGVYNNVKQLADKHGWNGATFTHRAGVAPTDLLRKHQGEKIIVVANSMGVNTIDDILEDNPDLKVDRIFAVVSAFPENFPDNAEWITRVTASRDVLRNFEIKGRSVVTHELKAGHVDADDDPELWEMVEREMLDVVESKPFYIGDYSPLEDADFIQIAKEYGLSEAHVRAVVEVEVGPNGKGSHTSGALVCLYEPHVAYRNTSGATRQALVDAGIAYRSWVRKYPKTSYPRIDQCVDIVERVRGDKEAGVTIAALATSWGLGQMLGENYKLCGYNSPGEMVRDFARGEVHQLRGMLEFVKNAGILDDLKAQRWDTFARRYNGPAYAKHNYHGRLAAAYKRWTEAIADRGEIIVVNPPVDPAPIDNTTPTDFSQLETAELIEALHQVADVVKGLATEIEGRGSPLITNNLAIEQGHSIEGNIEMTKSIFKSKTFWGIAGTLATVFFPPAGPIIDVLGGSAAAIDPAAGEQAAEAITGVVDALNKLIASATALFAIYGRTVAQGPTSVSLK